MADLLQPGRSAVCGGSHIFCDRRSHSPFRFFAVWERCPVTLFLIPGIFPLVPGAGVYWTSYYIVTGQLDQALVTGFQALKMAVAIVLGIVFIFELPQGFFRKIANPFMNKKKQEETR